MLRGLLAGLLLFFFIEPAPNASSTDWPPITKECRPWSYWWWPGSAVTREELTRQLEYHRRAGMGGLHIVPIYGVQGYEDRCIPFLSRQWMEMLEHTTREAEGLGLGIDMTLGTGWPYGGPWVEPDYAARHLFLEVIPATGAPISVKCARQPEAPCEALVAVADDGRRLDLYARVSADGRLDWTPPEGSWTLYAAFDGWTRQQVKRAAPGGEGRVMDFFSRAALDEYLVPFNRAFDAYSGRKVRAFYNDSYEVYGANWTPRLWDEFRARRGYDLRQHLPALAGRGEPEEISRVRSDYRETVDELLHERFTLPWVAWCHERGTLVRNQAHGSPGNPLDLYGAADIPETEGFGRGGGDVFLCKLASSAAALQGRKLVASECFTWLDEHFQVSLSRVRVALENYFLSGVNHVFYHGIPYSPAEAPFPGWLFYASTHFGESNSFAEHLPNLHRFIARCQSFLQAGEPDNPVLLYLPIYDLWAVDRGSADLLQFATVHNADHWLKTNLAPTYAASRRLWDEGFGFDYVSDRALVEMAKGRPAARYRAIVVAGCERMPPATLEALLALARAGMNVLFVDRPPRTAPGWKDWQARERKLSARLEELSWTAYEGQAGIRRARVGAGGVLVGEDLTTLLSYSGVPREALRDTGLEFARRRDGDSVIYYLANRTEQSFDDWLPLACTGEAAILFDPLHEAAGLATTRKDADGRLEVRLQLPAEQSIIARVLPRRVAGAAWVYCRLGGPMPLQTAGWRVQFTTGGPALPPDWTTLELKSWTEGSDAAMRDFSGTARYETAFVAPATPADGWMLDLGEVCDSARVYLNGQRVGDLWCKPFRIELSPHLRPGENRLTIEVANLLANRIAAMDRAGVAWRKFFFVNINYRPFDAADWPPRPSGLLGPVSLIPYMRATP